MLNKSPYIWRSWMREVERNREPWAHCLCVIRKRAGRGRKGGKEAGRERK